MLFIIFQRSTADNRGKGIVKGKGVYDSHMLRSGSIFPDQRLLVGDDVESFLTEAFRQVGVVRAVLHGLPGAGYCELLESAML